MYNLTTGTSSTPPTRSRTLVIIISIVLLLGIFFLIKWYYQYKANTMLVTMTLASEVMRNERDLLLIEQSECATRLSLERKRQCLEGLRQLKDIQQKYSETIKDDVKRMEIISNRYGWAISDDDERIVARNIMVVHSEEHKRFNESFISLLNIIEEVYLTNDSLYIQKNSPLGRQLEEATSNHIKSKEDFEELLETRS